MVKRIFSLLILSVFILSCDEESTIENEIAKIEQEVFVERFDKAFLEAQPKDLPKLKQAYPFLFSKSVPDSIWIMRMNDTLQKALLEEVTETFSNFSPIEAELKGLFQHLKYYDKTFSTPRVITLTNDVDYRNSCIVTDTLLLIALDNYLGEDHEFYQNLPRYIAANMKEDIIISDVAGGYAENYVTQYNRKTLLDEMIYFGKLLYFKDVVTPFISDPDKIGYTLEELQWAEANEEPIWSYFIEREMLFSTDNKLPNRFIANAPFSKFYLELDNESPGRLGQYIGWQIVRAYAKNTEENFMTILQKEPEDIFRISKFKPKK